MTIATQRRYVRTRRAAALHIVTSVNCRHPVAVVSWRTGGDNISATSIRRSPRSASNGQRREREREREGERTYIFSGEIRRARWREPFRLCSESSSGARSPDATRYVVQEP
ncbi:hypothetical protein ALC62_06424 [Cyphomyrmex costatus]|uniref:Uncharacterized protein n=1 Tax=Cyphomyrmex costatus TaxID=456900 RepID=A0A195CPR4_9HYME|nr:hypothetical protein ALC62_06424 [Cyphomyrmex costatus]